MPWLLTDTGVAVAVELVAGVTGTPERADRVDAHVAAVVDAVTLVDICSGRVRRDHATSDAAAGVNVETQLLVSK